MEPQMKRFKARLELLESMLKKMNPDQSRVRELKKSVYILRELLKKEEFKNPYGTPSVIVRFSVQ